MAGRGSGGGIYSWTKEFEAAPDLSHESIEQLALEKLTIKKIVNSDKISEKINLIMRILQYPI